MKNLKIEVEINIPDFWLEDGEPIDEVKANIGKDIEERLGALEIDGTRKQSGYKLLNIEEKK